jgi:hypothetical protein
MRCVWFGRPHQECRDVLGILIDGLWCVEADLTRLRRRRHGYDMAREICAGSLLNDDIEGANMPGRIAKAFTKIVMAHTVVINIEDRLAFR